MTVSIPYRIVNYVTKYSKFLVISTIIGGFDTTITIAQSKLFYLEMFNLQLKIDENKLLPFYKFINVTVLEVKCARANYICIDGT